MIPDFFERIFFDILSLLNLVLFNKLGGYNNGDKFVLGKKGECPNNIYKYDKHWNYE